MKTDFILADFRRPVSAPQWWEGHVIFYKEYPVKGGMGLSTLNLSARDGGRQKCAPWVISQPITVVVGGQQMRGEVYRVDICRPGWDTVKSATDFDPLLAEWIVTVCFPRIPKDHLRL